MTCVHSHPFGRVVVQEGATRRPTAFIVFKLTVLELWIVHVHQASHPKRSNGHACIINRVFHVKYLRHKQSCSVVVLILIPSRVCHYSRTFPQRLYLIVLVEWLIHLHHPMESAFIMLHSIQLLIKMSLIINQAFLNDSSIFQIRYYLYFNKMIETQFLNNSP